jgi:hypothetical protein
MIGGEQICGHRGMCHLAALAVPAYIFSTRLIDFVI